MARSRKPSSAAIAQRLAAVKLMLVELADAMPTMAKELRRSARETIDDVIEDLGKL